MANAQTPDHTNFKHDIESLGQQASTLKHDVATLAHGAVDAASSGATELRDAAKAKLEHASESAKEHYADAKAKAADAGKYMKHMVSEHPIATLGIALGVGLIAGFLLTRPRS